MKPKQEREQLKRIEQFIKITMATKIALELTPEETLTAITLMQKRLAEEQNVNLPEYANFFLKD